MKKPCALYVVQTENILKKVLISVHQNKNKGVLITVHNNKTTKRRVHETNESVGHIWHKNQNTTQPFSFSRGTYKYRKSTQILKKAFERFLHILHQWCRSKFFLILLQEKLKCKCPGMNFEKELFRMPSSI